MHSSPQAGSRARGKPRAEGITAFQLRRVLDTTGAEYAIFWRWSSEAGVLKAEAWFAHDGTLMEPDVGRSYAHGKGDVGSVWASKGTRLIRDVCAVDIKTFTRLQLACYYRIKSVAFAHCRGGAVEGILELGTSKLDWKAVPACNLFAQDVRTTAAEPPALEISRELLQSVVETSGAEYAIYWQNFGQVGELKAVRFYARDGTCMRRSQTFSIDRGDPIEHVWRLRTPTLLPDASTLVIDSFCRLPLVKHHKIRSIALHPLKHGVVEYGTTELWSVVPALPQLDALERESESHGRLGLRARAGAANPASPTSRGPAGSNDEPGAARAGAPAGDPPEASSESARSDEPDGGSGRSSIRSEDHALGSPTSSGPIFAQAHVDSARAERESAPPSPRSDAADLNTDMSSDGGGEAGGVADRVARVAPADGEAGAAQVSEAVSAEVASVEACLTASLLRNTAAQRT
ncbi:hypothetical protein KFE25_012156 [Diacronema lutheri]|uniref:Uncharacterized protein n=1 Tax=Diacronema lutheri TaxID=2081491 RepID=A0A8J6C8W9_DIALT|nr:hypothetical protein KFE25_012156 [Diacronema lutheri]